MKRNMDLIREILFQIEKLPYDGCSHSMKLKNYSAQEISYHLALLDEAGLIEADMLNTSQGYIWEPIRLTWQGHELLEVSKDKTRWDKAKGIMSKAGGFVFEVAKPLLINLMQNKISNLI